MSDSRKSPSQEPSKPWLLIWERKIATSRYEGEFAEYIKVISKRTGLANLKQDSIGWICRQFRSSNLEFDQTGGPEHLEEIAIGRARDDILNFPIDRYHTRDKPAEVPGRLRELPEKNATLKAFREGRPLLTFQGGVHKEVDWITTSKLLGEWADVYAQAFKTQAAVSAMPTSSGPSAAMSSTFTDPAHQTQAYQSAEGSEDIIIPSQYARPSSESSDKEPAASFRRRNQIQSPKIFRRA